MSQAAGLSAQGGSQNRAVQIAGDRRLNASDAAIECFKAYAKEHPEAIAWCAFGLGFMFGWKLKPW